MRIHKIDNCVISDPYRRDKLELLDKYKAISEDLHHELLENMKIRNAMPKWTKYIHSDQGI